MTTETTGNIAKAPASPGVTRVSDGNSELDALLAEHNETSATAANKTSNVSETLALAKELREDRAERKTERELKAKREHDDALKMAVAFLREPDDAKAASPALAQGFIFGYANDHPDFTKAFDERSQNPDAWTAQLTEAQKGFQTELKTFGSGPDVINDIEAAEAAVSGSTTETRANGKGEGPTPAEKGRMSDQEWAGYLAKTHGYESQ